MIILLMVRTHFCFSKWNFNRKNNKQLSLAGRLFYEDRWGGEMQWEKKYRGDEVYESIYTKRWELLGAYELPHGRKNAFSFSIQTMTKLVYGDIRI
jgi:outer membrane receptor for ferrienterochelin and colicins